MYNKQEIEYKCFLRERERERERERDFKCVGRTYKENIPSP